ncbi:unnamed protein product [Calypogeia fissa]
MGRSFVISATLLLCLALSITTTSAGVFELPIATSQEGTLNFWPRLNASCEMQLLQDSVCCLDSTFRHGSEAQVLLLKLLKRVPYPKTYEAQGVTQYLHKSSNGLEVGTRYMCDIPLGQEGQETPGLSCHRCLDAISREISSGLSQNKGRCRNSWAVRFGYIYEPDFPWEEDTTWCHLDYWFRVLPSHHPSTRVSITSKFRDMLTIAQSWLRKKSMTYFLW